LHFHHGEYDVLERFGRLFGLVGLGLNIERSNGPADLEVGRLPREERHGDDLFHGLHMLLVERVYGAVIGRLESEQEERLLFLEFPEEALVEVLAHHRAHAAQHLERLQHDVVDDEERGFVSRRYALLGHLHVEPAHILHQKIAERFRGAIELVFVEAVPELLRCGVEAADHPFIEFRQFRFLYLLSGVEPLQERDHVQDDIDIGRRFLHLVPAEFELIPDGVAYAPEPEAVRAVFVQDLLEGDEIAHGFAHLHPFLVNEESVHEYALVRACAVAHDSRAQQRVKPPSYLVLALYDEVRALAVALRVLWGQYRPDGVAGIEPDVEDVRNAPHLLAAFAWQGYLVQIRTVELLHLRDLVPRPDDPYLLAFALPYRERDAPVPLARDAPVRRVAH